MIKICKVLNKIHEQGIIHMDLKPENIMLDRSGNIYLIDFGAALFAGEKLSGYGTKNYASKKQAKTEERADIYFDIYSLGKTMESLLKATDAVQKIIEKCLIDDDAKRYHNIRQIQAPAVTPEAPFRKGEFVRLTDDAIKRIYCSRSPEADKQAE